MAVHEIYKGRIIHVRREDVVLPNGVTTTLELVRHPGAAAVVALDDGGQVVLIRQFRHAAGGFIWEVPAGTLHADEAPAACAARELQEETGLAAGELMPLGSVLPSPGFCDERIHLFLARQLTPVAQQLDRDEMLTVARVPLDRALAMIAADEIQDGKSIAALHRAAAYLGSRGPVRSKPSL
jgi:ADP-ribose pyrophosphatase